jgi:hypothetical protein
MEVSMYFMVMAMTKHQAEPTYVGRGGAGGAPQFVQAPQALEWHVTGVFVADSAEQACRAAAKKTQVFGSFFAIEGFPWGVDLMETEATEFGQDQLLSKSERLANRIRELEKETGIGQ